VANSEGRNSWVNGAWNASDIASAQTHLAPFIDELRGQASSTAPGRTTHLIELQVAQLLGLEREESVLGEAMKNWYSSSEFSDGEKAILEIAEQFVLDVHSVTDEQFEKLRKYFSTPDILAMLFHVALCDGFGKLEKVA
jgi:hypothetical protein